MHLGGARRSPASPRRGPPARPTRRCPRGCRRCPAGSVRGCRCPSSSSPRGTRTGPRRPAAARLALDRDLAVGGHELKDLALEHVGAGADQVRGQPPELGFSTKSRHRAVLVEHHQAVGAGVGDRHQRQRRAGSGGLVLGELGAEVDVGEHVAVEHQEALVEHRLGELHGAGGAARLGLLDVAQADPQPRAVAEHAADALGHEPAREDHVVDAVAAQPLEHERDEGPVDQPHDRLGDVRGQRAQAGAFAAGQDHRLRCGSPPPMPSYSGRRPAPRPGPARYARRSRGRPPSRRPPGPSRAPPTPSTRSPAPRRRRRRAASSGEPA